MVDLILAFVAVLFFCFCCHYFIKVIVTPSAALNLSPYNKSALKVQRSYSIFAWGLMTGVFLLALVAQFIQVYSQL